MQLTRNISGNFNRQMKNGRQRWIYSTSRQEGVLVKKTYKCAEYCESKEKNVMEILFIIKIGA